MLGSRSMFRASVVTITIAVVSLLIACKKPEDAGDPLPIKECDDYISRERNCAIFKTVNKPEERKKQLISVEEDRKKWAKDIKEAKPGLNMKSVCESLLRMANNPVSSEHKDCPTVWR